MRSGKVSCVDSVVGFITAASRKGNFQREDL